MNFFWYILFVITNWFPTILAYNLIFGKGKILHFGPVGVMAVSAYASVITLQMTGSVILAFFAGLCGGVLLSLLFAWLSLRLEPDGFGVLSLAVHLMILAVILNWNSITRGALGIPGIQRLPLFQTPVTAAMTMTVIAIFWLLFMILLDRSSYGRKLEALAEHEWHAAALGISRARIHTIAFLIGGLAAAIGALTWYQYIGLLHPNDIHFPLLILYVTMVVAGKPGSVLGVSLSIVLLTLLKEGLRFLPLDPSVLGPVRLILFGVILFGAVWWRRDTLFPRQRTV